MKAGFMKPTIDANSKGNKMGRHEMRRSWKIVSRQEVYVVGGKPEMKYPRCK
jgi:hypothetical protein